MITGIYKITNKINGKSYIGQSIYIERRWKDEKCAISNPNDNEYNRVITQAFRKYGIENFEFEVIEECEKEKLNEREKYWIDYYDTYHNGYNSTVGGDNAITSQKINQNDLEKIIYLLQANEISEQEISQLTGYSIGTISEINRGHIWKQDNLTYPLRTRVNNKAEKRCPICGKIISSSATICDQCRKDKTFGFKTPSKEELTNLLQKHKGNMSAVGRLYGVSKNPIKRLIQEYGLEEVLEEIKTLKKKDISSKVVDDLGNIFNSPADANRYYNTAHVKEVCDGKRKTAGGHSFMWLKE